MNLDFALDQGRWLSRFGWNHRNGRPDWNSYTILDVQARGGLCHGMATEWLFDQLQNQPWPSRRYAEDQYYRAISHQRGYAIFWQDALKNLWGTGSYNQYLQVASRPTERFVRDPARRRGLAFHTAHLRGLAFLPWHIAATGASAGLVITMFGSYLPGLGNNNPAPNPALPLMQNWGHTVAVSRSANGVYRFFDANEGQYSWPAATPNHTVGVDVYQQQLVLNYGFMGIRDVYVYSVH